MLSPFLLGRRLPFSAAWWEVPQREKENWEVCSELTTGFWVCVLWLVARMVLGALRCLPSSSVTASLTGASAGSHLHSVAVLWRVPGGLALGPGPRAGTLSSRQCHPVSWGPGLASLLGRAPPRVWTDETPLVSAWGRGHPTAPFPGPLGGGLAQLCGTWSFLNEAAVQIIPVGKPNTTDDSSACSVCAQCVLVRGHLPRPTGRR